MIVTVGLEAILKSLGYIRGFRLVLKIEDLKRVELSRREPNSVAWVACVPRLGGGWLRNSVRGNCQVEN
jgi:hypothetical protein